MSKLTELIAEAQSKNLSFSKSSFESSVDELIQKVYFDGDKYDNVGTSFEGLIDKLNITPEEEKQLVALQKLSPFIGDKESAKKFLPIALFNIRNKKIDYGNLGTMDGGELDATVDYFLDDTHESNTYNQKTVEFAAMLYYDMVMGDELEIFNAADALITKHLRSRKYNIDIRSRATMDAIRLYTFGEKFENLKNGETYQKSQEAERMMFYNQVFGTGAETGFAHGDSNDEFGVLWNSLMEEAASFIEKVEKSDYYDNISRNNIYQAIEDLQYNLSNNCTGLAKVAANVINLELKFIMNKLFADKDIREQIGKRDRTSFGVLKQILLDLNEERGDMTVQNIQAINNKAILGHKILSEIARFTPAYMETGDNFGKFITDVQAYFLAQKIIEKHRGRFNLQDIIPGGGEQQQTDGGDQWDF